MNKKNIGLSAVLFILVGLFIWPGPFIPKGTKVSLKQLSETSFFGQAAAGNIVRATESLDGDLIELNGSLKSGEQFTSVVNPKDSRYQESLALIPDVSVETKTHLVSGTFLYLLPTIVIFVFLFLIMRGGIGGIRNFSQSNAQIIADGSKQATFDDVAGVDEAKQEVRGVVNFLRDPKRFSRLGGKVPRGILLVGPPGAGKTLLARAVAGEAGVPFFSMSGSGFVEMFVGVGASRVRDLFAQAKKYDAAIIFIDELDAVGRMRTGSNIGFRGVSEHEQTLNQLLVEMGGLEQRDNIIVLAATNRPELLDPALLRPGRFDRKVVVDAPDVKGREKILLIHAAGKRFANARQDLKRLAKITTGLVGADLANLLNEAALAAAESGAKAITWQHLQAAEDKVAVGPARKSKRLSPRDKKIVAYHEVGHAVVGKALKDGSLPTKITCIVHGQSLGHTRFISDGDQYLQSKSQLLKELAIMLGGRAAEELFCGGTGEVTNGASNDIKQATRIAGLMVTSFGMGSRGPVDLSSAQESEYLGRLVGNARTISEQTLCKVDKEIETLLARALQEAKDILTGNKGVVHKLADLLIKKETLYQGDLRRVFKNA